MSLRLRASVGLIGVVLISLGTPSAARADEALSLSMVLGSVERSFPLLKAAETEKTLAEADTLSAEGGFDLSWKTRATILPISYYDSLRIESSLEKPTAIWGASAFAGYRLGTGRFPGYYGNQETLEYGEVRAGVNVPLWRNGPIDRRRSQLQRAELGQEVATRTVQQQRIEFLKSASYRYWAWVAAGKRQKIATDLLATGEGRDAGLLERTQRGDIPAVERTDNLRAIEQRRAQFALARRGLEQATLELSLFYRDSAGRPQQATTSQLPSGFPEVAELSMPQASDVAVAQSRRPEASRLSTQIAREQIEARYAENQQALGLDVQVAGSQDIGRSNTLRPDLAKPVVEVSILLDVPLQTRAMQGRSDAARASVTRLQAQRKFAQERIEIDVRDAHSGIRAARARVQATRSEVKLAVELEESERIKFQQGDSHLLIVNLREQQTSEAELRQVDAELDYFRAIADLRAAKGE
jgi:outer membrane protein, heavy metal efflux system